MRIVGVNIHSSDSETSCYQRSFEKLHINLLGFDERPSTAVRLACEGSRKGDTLTADSDSFVSAVSLQGVDQINKTAGRGA
jgi:hypothetical protein